jgi:hypothetical protein
MGLRAATLAILAAAAAGAGIAILAASSPAGRAALARGEPTSRGFHAAAAPGSAAVRSRAVRMSAGRRRAVLRLRDVGRFVVSCRPDRRATVAFRPDHLLPTADVVVHGPRGVRAATVQPERRWTAWRRPSRVLAETWQVAPFAAAEVRVHVVRVVSRRLPRQEAFGCAASALAISGPDQGATGTG